MTQLPEQTPVGAEQVMEVIGGITRVRGFLGASQKRFTLVVTDRRLVFAEFTNEKLKELTRAAKEHAREEGKGALGRLGAAMGVSAMAAEPYRTMAPEVALAENPENFALDRADVRKVRFKLGPGEAAAETMILKTGSGTYKFHVGSMRRVKEAFARAGIG